MLDFSHICVVNIITWWGQTVVPFSQIRKDGLVQCFFFMMKLMN